MKAKITVNNGPPSGRVADLQGDGYDGHGFGTGNSYGYGAAFTSGDGHGKEVRRC